MTEPDTDRDPVELLAAEFTERCRRGERPSIDDYARVHPELAEEIRDLFPTIAALEQVKSASPKRNVGGPVRGGLKLERLGDFRIIRELGRGGMGIVYEAEQESLGRRVALKVLPRQLLLDPGQLERFEREARTAARLHHTNIVPVFGVGEHDGYHFFVMQYIRGVGLDVVLRKLRRTFRDDETEAAAASTTPTRTNIDAVNLARSLARDASDLDDAYENPKADSSLDQPSIKDDSFSNTTGTPRAGQAYWHGIARIALQAADALEYAHGQDTLHRDIKPANLLIDADGAVWVADFGLAKMLDQDDVTQTYGVAGTWRYMAPERYEGIADARGDVYSLGLTLYELATLRPAFAETSKTTLIHAITRGAPAAPRQCCSDVPRDLETIILKSIARDPAGRYASAGALAADIRRFLEDRPILARRATASERLWRWARRNPAIAALSGVAAALLIAVAAISTAAYVHTSRANVRVRNALAGEQTQRLKAEATSILAIEALDTIFEQLAPKDAGTTSTLTIDDAVGTKIEMPIQPVLSRETATLLEHMLGFYRRLAAREDAAPAIRLKIAKANQRVGDIHRQLGNFEAAAEAYTRAVQLYEQLEDDSGAAQATRTARARIHAELGMILLAQEHVQEGRASLRKSRAILEDMHATPSDSPAVCYELARTCFQLGKAPRPPIPLPPRRPPGQGPPPNGMSPPHGFDGPPRRGDRPPPAGRPPRRERVDGMNDSGRKAIDILTELREADPNNPEYRRLLALCYRDLPPANAKNQPSPVEKITQAIEILQQLVSDFPEAPEYRHDLSTTYAMSSVPRLCPGPDPRAIEEQRLRAALDISEKLVAERPNIPDYVVSQVHIRMRFADFLRRGRQLDAAEDHLRKARALQASLVHSFPDIPAHQVFTAVIDGALARLMRDSGRLDEARSQFEAAITILNGLPDDRRRPRYVRDVLAATYKDLADVHRQSGDQAAAEEAVRQAERHRPDR